MINFKHCVSCSSGNFYLSTSQVTETHEARIPFFYVYSFDFMHFTFMYVCAPHVCMLSTEIWRETDPLELELGMVGPTMWCYESNPGFLQV